MRTEILLLLLAVAFPGERTLADKSKKRQIQTVRAEVSENVNYLVRLEEGNSDKNATALVFRFDPKSRTYVRIKRVKLSNPGTPRFVYITNNGRYIVALNETHGTENAVVIYDLVENNSKAFALEDFLTKEVISEQTRWYRRIRWWIGSRTLDNKNLKLYTNGLVPGIYYNYPYVVVDIARMKVSIETPSARILKLAEEAKQKQKVAEQLASNTGLRSESQAKSVFHERIVAEMSKRPRIDIVGFGYTLKHLIRLEPGGEGRKAKALIFRFDPKTQTYNKVHDLALRNPIAPNSMLITNSGRYLVTFDDLHKIGVTENAIVIYDLPNKKWKAFAVEDFLTKDDISKLRQVKKTFDNGDYSVDTSLGLTKRVKSCTQLT